MQLALERVLVGRTAIVIAHRLSTVLKADQIWWCRKAGSCSGGRMRSWAAVPGLYEQLYRTQFADQAQHAGGEVNNESTGHQGSRQGKTLER